MSKESKETKAAIEVSKVIQAVTKEIKKSSDLPFMTVKGGKR